MSLFEHIDDTAARETPRAAAPAEERTPLTKRQIALLLWAHRQGGDFFYLHIRRRPLAVTLWRRGILQVWYRQDDSGLVGPYFHLTFTRKLAEVFVARRRVQLLPEAA